jgi:penicillin-binding protein 1C
MRAYGALANDGVLRDLQWYEDQPLAEPRGVLSPTATRLVTQFLSDPQARLPAFPRYGSTEYPFPVALKTGTSQGYRDAWTMAWSQNYVVGAWMGRADAGTMAQVSGARGAASAWPRRCCYACTTAPPMRWKPAAFPAPQGYEAHRPCAPRPASPTMAHCGPTLTEWLPAGQAAPPPHRQHRPTSPWPPKTEAPRLSILSPEHNSRLWRNPELPPSPEPPATARRRPPQRSADRLVRRWRALRRHPTRPDRLLAHDTGCAPLPDTLALAGCGVLQPGADRGGVSAPQCAGASR